MSKRVKMILNKPMYSNEGYMIVDYEYVIITDEGNKRIISNMVHFVRSNVKRLIYREATCTTFNNLIAIFKERGFEIDD